MIPYCTEIIRPVARTEILGFLADIENNKHRWTSHGDSRETALHEGKTLHVQRVDFDLTVEENNFSDYPNTIKFIQENVNNKIGRVYWHRLLPGEQIVEHDDIGIVECFNRQLHKRYQVYLDLTDDFLLVLDGQFVSNPSKFSNTLVDFNLERSHYYKNTGTKPFYLLVFDALID